MTVAPLTMTALSSAPAEKTGLASAVNNTVARTGSLLAVALLPAVAGITGDSYLHPSVFETGFQHAAFIAAVICAGAGGLAPPRRSAIRARRRPRIRCWKASITAISTPRPCVPRSSTGRHVVAADAFQ